MYQTTDHADPFYGRDPDSIDYIESHTATPLPAIHWAHGATCAAITRKGTDCTRNATHYAKARYPLCKVHATSWYVVDVRKA